MHKFVRNLVTEWRKLGLPFSGASLVVGVSGGADSVSLLLALADLRTRKKLELRIIAAHFNHKLRPESDADEAFVKELAEKNDVEFVSGQMRRPNKGNLEEIARRERYKFLEASAIKGEAFAVLTAHTKNDQAETFLMNLIRGSGVTGLSAMRPVREMESGTQLVRPLLSWAMRLDTEGFCQDNHVGYRTDPMNDDPRFTRVRVRKDLIPRLAEYNPKIIETLARTAEMLSGLETDDVQAPAASLPISELRILPKPALYRTLRSWLRSRRSDLRRIELKHIESIERLIQSQKSGRAVELPGGQTVIKQNGQLSFVQAQPAEIRPEQADV